MKFSNKLSFAILATGLIVLIISSFTLYNFSYNTVIDSQFMYTQSIADEVSDDIDHLLHEKVKTALTLANTPIIKKALETSNLSYSDLSAETRKESIKRLNEKWKSTKDPTNNFILKFTDNKVSHFLKNQQALLKGEYGEIFLTNKFGALVASTAKLSTLAHGHKYWWLGSYNNGEGAVFFDDRGYDDSVGGYVLGLVVPIRKGTEIIGILKCNLNILGSISELLSGADHKFFGKIKLIRSGGMVVFEKGFEPLSTQVHGSIFKKLKNKKSGSFIINDSGEKVIVGCSEIELTKGGEGYGFGGTFESIDHKKGNTGESWYVVCSRQMSAALMPFTQSIKTIILIGIAIILILVLVSYLFGRKIAKPLAVLNKATEKIGTGDFKYRIGVMGKDEFGNLGNSVNSMASKLQQTTTSIVELEHEITERKQAEEALRESEEKYRNLFTSTNDGACVHELIYKNDKPLDYRISDVNPRYESIIGAKRDDVIGVLGSELYGSGEAPYLNIYADVVKTGRSKSFETYFAPMGKYFLISVFSTGAHKFATVFQDITEAKQAEEALRESEERYRSMSKSMKDPVYMCSQDFRIEYMNPSMIRRIGYDATGEKCFKAVHELNEKCPWCMYDRTQQGEHYEVAIVSPKDNRSYHVSSSPVVHGDGTISKMTVFRDTTDFKKLETQLQHAQKMESVGRLAGGVAHDFNNNLAVIQGYTQIMLEEINDKDAHYESLKAVLDAAERSAALTRQLLAFARKQTISPKRLDLNDTVEGMLKMLRRLIGENIELLWRPGNLWNIKMDPAQIDQILANLCVNAKDAIDGIGKLTIETRNVDLDSSYCSKHAGFEPGQYAMLAVSDDGSGMDKATLQEIFEPFFTTKEVGKGTGLGLSTIYGIVKQNDAFINVYSEPGKGTTFKIYIPRYQGELPHDTPDRSEEIRKGHGEPILLVEDDVSVLNLSKTLLERLGYTVFPANGPDEAIAIAKEATQIHLLMTDVVMPQMGGNELAKKITEIQPHIQTIFMSGYTANAIAHQGILDEGVNFIEKPFTLNDLGRKIGDILKNARS